MQNHNERKFSIDRILRVRVRSVASAGSHQSPGAALTHFGRWTSFDSGKGTDGDHLTVGCKKLYENRAAVYYSLPGGCWSKTYNRPGPGSPGGAPLMPPPRTIPRSPEDDRTSTRGRSYARAWLAARTASYPSCLRPAPQVLLRGE
jgi:hypothetical protein